MIYSTGESNHNRDDTKGSIDNKHMKRRMGIPALTEECGQTLTEVPTCSNIISHNKHIHADISKRDWTAFTDVRRLQQLGGGGAISDTTAS